MVFTLENQFILPHIPVKWRIFSPVISRWIHLCKDLPQAQSFDSENFIDDAHSAELLCHIQSMREIFQYLLTDTVWCSARDHSRRHFEGWRICLRRQEMHIFSTYHGWPQRWMTMEIMVTQFWVRTKTDFFSSRPIWNDNVEHSESGSYSHKIFGIFCCTWSNLWPMGWLK
jgi:hypothetical protein